MKYFADITCHDSDQRGFSSRLTILIVRSEQNFNGKDGHFDENSGEFCTFFEDFENNVYFCTA